MRTIFRAAAAAAILTALAAGRVAAYSELHVQKNMYPKKEPDIIADTVTRTERGGPVPVFLVIRHSDIFPVELARVVITADLGGGAPPVKKTVEYNLRLKRLWWTDLQYADVPADFTGTAFINVDFVVKFRDGREKTIHNNNRRIPNEPGAAGEEESGAETAPSRLNHAPLRVLVGAPPLPRLDGWYYGDTHFHTWFSENAAEFAAPQDVSALMAERFGLDWIAFTDHSFDLDDTEGDSETNDPALPRWRRYEKEIGEAAAAHPGVTLIPGMELSCGNSKGQNVHMLVYNPHRFYVGNGDGYEGGASTPDTPCAEVAAGLARHEAAFAAHPITNLTSAELYVINRGNWGDDDLAAPGLTGHQSWNGSPAPIPGGIESWVRALLAGHRKVLLAGTDAHGGFNYELAGWPENTPMGGLRTAVLIEGVAGRPTKEDIIDALKAGRAVATSGPLVTLELTNAAMKTAGVGGEIAGGPFVATVRARSTAEFGPVSTIKLILGDPDAGAEKIAATWNAAYAPDPMNVTQTLKLPADVARGYVRVEAASKSGDTTFLAFTNPVWFER